MTTQPKQFSYEYASIFQDASVVAAYPIALPIQTKRLKFWQDCSTRRFRRAVLSMPSVAPAR